ncbi:MAG: TolC family protein [Muribaculaceae bacterium]|nr:TolC family protein [Muribaculaceae bacterium]
MRAILTTFATIAVTLAAAAQSVAPGAALTLEECRSMALVNNKDMKVAGQKIKTAEYQSREAFAAYLPAIDFAGGYMYNQKDISIFSSDQMLPTKTFNPKTGSYDFNLVTNPATGEPIKGPDGQYVPETVALIPKEAMTYDIHNVFFGAITLTQPIFMGGKIVAMNKLTHYAKDLAEALRDNEAENVIYAVDAAYWQVVSLKSKYQLAESYVNLLDSLDRNVGLMVAEGVATKADKLSVDVKLNSARVDLTKVENGLVLSRMALAQICGLPLDSPMVLADEDIEGITDTAMPATNYDMEQVYSARPDLRALQMGINIAGQQKRVAMASMLPNLALVGSYSFSNPNMFNGFSKKFNGAFSVGAMLTIPIWHWGGNYNKYKAAESEQTVMELKMQDAKEMVDLQVKQAAFRAQESVKTYSMTRVNQESADENLRTATLAFKEGVATTDNVMEAQTAWLKAHSELIDALIDVHLCDTYLSKVLGTL